MQTRDRVLEGLLRSPLAPAVLLEMRLSHWEASRALLLGHMDTYPYPD